MISVITITFNRAHLIGETIQSVLSQSYPDLEYIIVDDGSTDGTAAIVKSFNDSRIIYVRVVHSGRIAWLRNKAMQLAQGDFIAFVDSDDLWENEKLALQLEPLLNHLADFSFCEAEIFTPGKIILPSLYEKHQLQSENNFFGRLISDVSFVLFPSTVLFRKSCLSVTGYLKESQVSGDKEFLCRLALHFNGAFINKKLARIRKHEENVTNDFEHVKGILEDELTTTHNFYREGAINKKLYKKLSAMFYYKLAEHYYHKKNFSEAKKNFSSSFVLNPLSWRAFAKTVVSAFQSG
jgi:glycosyltransferase involved in cell wall biosynthesis